MAGPHGYHLTPRAEQHPNNRFPRTSSCLNHVLGAIGQEWDSSIAWAVGLVRVSSRTVLPFCFSSFHIDSAYVAL